MEISTLGGANWRLEHELKSHTDIVNAVAGKIGGKFEFQVLQGTDNINSLSFDKIVGPLTVVVTNEDRDVYEDDNGLFSYEYMFDNCRGEDVDNNPTAGTIQAAYWTDEITIMRVKLPDGKWKYSTEER
jgi:hypothetical protein